MKTLKMILLLSVFAIWANHFACTHNDNKNSVEIKTVPSEEYDFELVEKIKRIENDLLPAIDIIGRQTRIFKLTDRMAHFKVPGVSIAVINNGEIEWAKGYGSKEIGKNEEVTTKTLFQAASLSKPIVAMAALHLVEKGKLNMESDVNNQLKSWKIPENEFTASSKVSLKKLIIHVGGLSVSGFRGYATGEKIPTPQQILDGQKPANSEPIRVIFEPGSRWRYSGGGYCVIQLMMIESTEMEFPELMKKFLLEPISMKNSTFAQPLSSEFLENVAAGHRSDGSMVNGKWHAYPEMAAAGLWTTSMDLCRFIIEIQKSYKVRSNRVLSKEMTQKMLTRHSGNFGLGFLLGGQDDSLYFTFNGGNEGYRCDFFAYVKKDQGAVVMTNSDNGGRLIKEILRSIAAEYN